MNKDTINLLVELLKAGGSINIVGSNVINLDEVDTQYNIPSDEESRNLIEDTKKKNIIDEFFERYNGVEEFGLHFKYFSQLFDTDDKAREAIFQMARFSNYDNVLNYLIRVLDHNRRITYSVLMSAEIFNALNFFLSIKDRISLKTFHKKVDLIYNEHQEELAKAQKGETVSLEATAQN